MTHNLKFLLTFGFSRASIMIITVVIPHILRHCHVFELQYGYYTTLSTDIIKTSKKIKTIFPFLFI